MKRILYYSLVIALLGASIYQAWLETAGLLTLLAFLAGIVLLFRRYLPAPATAQVPEGPYITFVESHQGRSVEVHLCVDPSQPVATQCVETLYADWNTRLFEQHRAQAAPFSPVDTHH